jgi:hypothetical protein
MAFKNEEFLKVKYYAYNATGSGASAADPASPVDGDIMAIEEGMVVEGVDVIVTTSITGATQLDVGDDDDQNGFVAAATLTAGQPVVGAGAYLASGAKKYYSAAGKEVKLDMTGTVSAGAFIVKVKGYKV